MATNTTPVFPLTPYIAIADLSAASAATSRVPTATASMTASAVYGIALGTAAPTAGRRIDKIVVKGCATAINGATTAGTVIIWLDNATTSFPICEILTPVVTPSASVASIEVERTFTDFVIPSGYKLWASTTIAGASAAHALTVYAFCGNFE
jgi:hypothetical protein